ncbi:MAG: PIN domain-containing protein [Deltaproteobacteria bacterium]|nr:PIN domain-containing protein [Deltaproteobacteria bacterium]
MLYYWDTSAILSFIFKESLSPLVIQHVQKKNSLPGFTSFFSWIEVESAIYRRIYEKSLEPVFLTELRLKVQSIENSFNKVWPNHEMLDVSKHIISQYGLKPGDSLQLSSCLSLKKENCSFVCLDKKLNQVARALALSVEFE